MPNLDNIQFEMGSDDYAAVPYVLSKIKYNGDIDVKSSSGASIVIIPEKNQSEIQTESFFKNVYQYFYNEEKAREIFELMNKLHRNKKAFLLVTNEKNKAVVSVPLEFYSCLPELVSYIPKNIIVWKRHWCLNEFTEEYMCIFLETNYTKFLWDIGKALLGLHSLNIAHRDVSIDNIGYNTNTSKFVLFDFNLSSLATDNYAFENDFHIFYRSLKFRLSSVWDDIRSLTPQSYNSNAFLNDVLTRHDINVEDIEILDLII